MQEGGKAINSVIDSLKGNPFMLAMVIMNLALLAFLFYIAQQIGAQRQREIAQIYAQFKETQDLLLKCRGQINDMRNGVQPKEG